MNITLVTENLQVSLKRLPRQHLAGILLTGAALIFMTPCRAAAPSPLTCPEPATNTFTGCYYNTLDLTGDPALVRTDNQIAFNWGISSFSPYVTVQNFSVRWQGNFTFSQGDYAFTIITSDGMRAYIDGNLFFDRWRDQAPTMYTSRQTLTAGIHLITVEYYQHTGSPQAELSWTPPSSAAGQPPSITSFLSSPAAVAPGQSATLSWNVSGATALSIDNGVGDVSSLTAKSVSPQQTTTYTLTASNSSGVSAASVSVTVNTSTTDTQPPTAPTITSILAKSSTEVDLSWSPSNDNTGVAGYQISPNGNTVGTVSGNITAWADTSAAANTTYNYTVKAFDSSGNYSAPGSAAQVTTPSPAVTSNTGCP